MTDTTPAPNLTSPALWLDGWIRQQSWAAECEALRVAGWCEDDPPTDD